MKSNEVEETGVEGSQMDFLERETCYEGMR